MNSSDFQKEKYLRPKSSLKQQLPAALLPHFVYFSLQKNLL